MKITILTLFKEMFDSLINTSIIKRTIDKGLVEIEVVNFRDYSTDRLKRVDDAPYGGGSGMVMSAQPVYDCYMSLIKDSKIMPKTIYLTPHGKTFNQQMAKELAKEEHLIFLCGHYEGIDQRVIDIIEPMEVSLGDFVLTGGELAVLPICDSILRLVPGVLGNENSMVEESFENNLLEYPQYTRPEEFMGRRVPDVLLSGHHKNIEKWRHEQSVKITELKRPDLLNK